MFPRHARYVTRRANEVLSPDIQAILWAIIDRDLAESKELDYLQVFSLTIVHSGDVMYQRIRQTQEHPKRKKCMMSPASKSPFPASRFGSSTTAITAQCCCRKITDIGLTETAVAITS